MQMSDDPNASKQEVDGLIEQIREAARLERTLPTGGAARPSPASASGPLDGHLAELARRSHPRTELPLRFRRFPLTLAPVRSVALRVYNLLTREQRATNVLLRDALQALQAAHLRSQLASRESAVVADYVRSLLLNARVSGQTRQSAASPPEVKTAVAPELDSFFAAHGDQFRGSPELIKDRLRVYPPMIRRAGLTGPALDLGCGRGEWLELMREAEIESIGVEQNQMLAAACRAKSLHVIEADFMAFLEQSPPDHWRIVTGFHVIEHLGWPAWYGCLRHIHRVLSAGGMVILETPNPASLLTATNGFFLDPTHRHPLPDALLAFAARDVGFAKVEILPLHPAINSGPGSGAGESEIMQLVNGPQDYALIARK
jgi:predicted TPR repeat methyltransferase